MATSPHKRKRRTTIVAPVTPEQQRAVEAASRPAASLYHWERYDDGSLRAARNSTRARQERELAMQEFFGGLPLLPTRANMRTMDSVLAEIVENLGLQEDDFTPALLAEAWERAVGAFLASRTSLVAVTRGTATIRTSHPAVHFELQRLKNQIVRVLNEVLGDGSVTRVRILHG